MIWMSRNNFLTSLKSYVLLKLEQKLRNKLLSTFSNTWKPFAKIFMWCKDKTNKQRLFWQLSEIFIKKLNGMDKTCISRCNRSCGTILSTIWNLSQVFFKLEHANYMLSMEYMSFKNKLIWNKLHNLFSIIFGVTA